MGDRVAVMKQGRPQQVATPQTLYDAPDNLFVGGFIGSPAMNMVEATLERDGQGAWVAFGDIRLRVPDEVMTGRPGLAAFEGRQVVVGIRPESIEDAAIASDAPADRRIRTTVELREALGSEVLVHFDVAAPPVLTEDTKELARDAGGHDRLDAAAERKISTFVARLGPKTGAQKRKPIELAVDTTRLYFFDPTNGLSIDGDGAPPS
jgi:multiple sugar transport system ATP-binding protein